MESFKAANPGCILEDFVRWYSPRDWIIEDGEEKRDVNTSIQGHLSVRMQIPGNLWVQAWESANSVPAFKQKSLVDHTTQAEKAIIYLRL